MCIGREKSSSISRVGEFATQIKICRKKRLGKVPTFGKNPRHTFDFSQKLIFIRFQKILIID